MRRIVAIALLACGACASVPDAPSRERLPSAAEVAAHIESTWISDGWGSLFARFASRPGEAAALVRVDNVQCDYYYDRPDCRFDVTGRFETGEIATHNLSSTFEWRDGQLTSVILSVHTRRVR